MKLLNCFKEEKDTLKLYDGIMSFLRSLAESEGGKWRKEKQKSSQILLDYSY